MSELQWFLVSLVSDLTLRMKLGYNVSGRLRFTFVHLMNPVPCRECVVVSLLSNVMSGLRSLRTISVGTCRCCSRLAWLGRVVTVVSRCMHLLGLRVWLQDLFVTLSRHRLLKVHFPDLTT